MRSPSLVPVPIRGVLNGRIVINALNPIVDFGPPIKSRVLKRRLFVSACSATNRALAESIMSGSDCYSILGPAPDINLGDAVAL
jgi:hypothetical protein